MMEPRVRAVRLMHRLGSDLEGLDDLNLHPVGTTSKALLKSPAIRRRKVTKVREACMTHMEAEQTGDHVK